MNKLDFKYFGFIKKNKRLRKLVVALSLLSINIIPQEGDSRPLKKSHSSVKKYSTSARKKITRKARVSKTRTKGKVPAKRTKARTSVKKTKGDVSAKKPLGRRFTARNVAATALAQQTEQVLQQEAVRKLEELAEEKIRIAEEARQHAEKSRQEDERMQAIEEGVAARRQQIEDRCCQQIEAKRRVAEQRIEELHKEQAEITHLAMEKDADYAQQIEEAVQKGKIIRQQAQEQLNELLQTQQVNRQKREEEFAQLAEKHQREQEAITQYIKQKFEQFHQQQNFLKLPFAKQEFTRYTDAGDEINFIGADLGYAEGVRSRTQQYAEAAMNFPVATVLHPHDPADNTINFSTPAFMLNVKLPGCFVEEVPEALRAHLAGTVQENIDLFMVVQDMPWQNVPLQPKPHYWRFPNTPNELIDPADEQEFTAEVGVFSKQYPHVRIQGQPEGGLVGENPFTVHADAGRRMISSGDILPIENLDLTTSQFLYSLVKTKEDRAAVTLHLLLNREDGEEFQRLMPVSNTLSELKRNIRGAKARPGGPFATLDLDDLF